MREFILKMIHEANFLETIVIWGFMLLGPIMLFVKGLEGLRDRYSTLYSKLTNLLYLSGSLVSAALVVLFLIEFGREFIQHTRDSLGPFVLDLLIVIAVCVIMMPMSFVGAQFRTAWRYRGIPDSSSKGRTAFIRGILGIFVILVFDMLLLIFASNMLAFGFGALALIAIILGWFGYSLFPDL